MCGGDKQDLDEFNHGTSDDDSRREREHHDLDGTVSDRSREGKELLVKINKSLDSKD